MTAIWTWVRADLRGSARSTLLVVVLIGVGAGVSIAALAGARRTETAYERFLVDSSAATHRLEYSTEEDVDDQVLERLRSHPDVRAAIPIHMFIAFSDATEYDLGIISSGDPAFGREIDRLRMVDGRLAEPDSVDEVVVSSFLADQAGVGVGDRIELGTFSAEQVDQEDFGSPPAGPAFDLEVVGVGYTPDELADEESGFLYTSPAFHAQAVDVVGGFGPSIELLVDAGTDAVEIVDEALAGVELAEAPTLEGTEVRSDRVADTTDALANGLMIFAACAALAATLAAGQAIVRRLAVASADHPILEAIGLARTHRAVALVGIAVPLIAAGVALAVVVAVIGSQLMPVGLARRAEPSPGIDIDVAAIGLGALATTIVLLLVAGLSAARLVRRGSVVGEDGAAARPSAGATVAKRAGWTPSAVLGISMALEPGRGRTAVPVRPALVGAVAGTAGIVAALTFAASLEHVVSTPAAYGWNWSVSPDLFEGDAETLAAQDEIEDVGLLQLQQVEVDDQQLQGMAVVPVKGDPSFSMLDGRMPATKDEVAIGRRTADELGRGIGDTMTLGGPDGNVDVSIVGEAMFPVFDENPFNDGVALHPDLLGDAAVTGGFGAAMIGFRSGVSTEEGMALIDDLLPEALTIYSQPTRPPDVENLAQVRGMPLALAAFLIVLAVAAVGHALVTTVRRRRRDLGVMRVIGFRRRQVAESVTVQSITLTAIGIAVGVPLGIAVGRTAWALVANGVGVAPSIVIPVARLVLLVPLAGLVAILLAVLPARSATQLTTAEVLRTE